MSKEAFCFGKIPLQPYDSTSKTITTIKQSLDYVKSSGIRMLSVHPFHLGFPCTVLLKKDYRKSLIIDTLGNVIEGISDNVKQQLFQKVASSMPWSRKIRSHVVYGIVPNYGLFRTNPLRGLSYSKGYNHYDITSRFLIYRPNGIARVCSFSDVVRMNEYHDYINGTLKYNDCLEAKLNQDVFNQVFISTEYNKYVKNNNDIYPYSMFSSSLMTIIPFISYNYLLTNYEDVSIWDSKINTQHELMCQKAYKIEKFSMMNDYTSSHLFSRIGRILNHFVSNNRTSFTPILGVVLKSSSSNIPNSCVIINRQYSQFFAERSGYNNHEELLSNSIREYESNCDTYSMIFRVLSNKEKSISHPKNDSYIYELLSEYINNHRKLY